MAARKIITYFSQNRFLVPLPSSSILLRNPNSNSSTNFLLLLQHCRLLSCSSSSIKPTTTTTKLENKPSSSSDTIMKHGDWTPPKIYRGIDISELKQVDLGRWIFYFQIQSLPHYSEKGMYDLAVKTLAPFVGGCVKEAKKRIYVISPDPYVLGFGAYVDKEIADKLKDLECIMKVSPDFFDDVRRKDPETHRMSQ